MHPTFREDTPQASFAAAQLRERQFRAIIDALPAAVYMTDEHGCITHFNPACVEMSGRTPELGTDYWCVTWKLFYPDGTRLPHDQCPMAVTLKTGKPVRGVEAIAERPDGSRVWFEPYPTPLFDEDGKIVGGVNMLVDITERKTAEEKLRFSEQRYHQLLELLPVAVYTCEAPSGRITYFNESAAKLWGRRPKINDSSQTFCGSYKIFLPDGTLVPHDQCPMAIALREGKSFRNVHAEFERPDGARMSAMVNIDPIRDTNGAVVGAVNAFIDVTAIKQAEAAISRLAAIVESSDDAIVSKDLSGIIRSWNRGAERLFGYTAEEAIGQPITMLIPEDRRSEEPDILRRVRSGEVVDHYETVRRHKDGTLLDISLSVSPVRDSAGTIIGASKISRDITLRKRIEAERAEHAANLEAALAERTRELTEAHESCRRSEAMAILGALSAGIAHDLSNLLLPMRTRLHLLQRLPGVSAEVSEHLTAIGRNVDYIGELGQRVRQYMRDATKDCPPAAAEAHPELIDLSVWCKQVQPFLQSIVPSDGSMPLHLECSIDESLPQLLLNKTGLTQTVYNLVQNAAKAMRASEIGSTIRIRAWSDDEHFVFIAVEDDGPGMPQDVLARWMEPPSVFDDHQFDVLGSGSGMGLQLVKAFCDHAGGEVRVYSPRPFTHADDLSTRGTAVVMRFSFGHDKTSEQ